MVLIKFYAKVAWAFFPFFVFHVPIIYNESSQKVFSVFLNCIDMAKAGEIINSRLKLLSSANKLLMTPADVSALGANRNFIGFFLPFRENCQNSQETGNI